MQTLSDNPTELLDTARGMANFLKEKNAITSPWWKVGRSVNILGMVAADKENPLSDVAVIAMQIMAENYNS